MISRLFTRRTKQESVVDVSSIRAEMAMRASISNKLKRYNASKDTTISEFHLAANEPVKPRKPSKRLPTGPDPWSLANPAESGKWTKSARHEKK